MIPEGTPIEPDMIVSNDVFGGLYAVVDGEDDTDDIEESGELNGKGRISYIQLYDGRFPTGHKWNKDAEKFRRYFTIVENPVARQIYLNLKND